MIADRIARARKAAGLSLRDVGQAVGLSHAAIKKYEDGVVVPSSDVLLGLARVLNVRTEFFFRQQQVRLEAVEYRKRGLPAKVLLAIEHQVLDLVERRLELEALFPRPPGSPFEPIPGHADRIVDLDGVEGEAEAVRNAWDLGSDPIPDLVDVLEAHGVRVYMLDDSHGCKFDGLAAHVDGHPVIVVGKAWPGDRQRFTLAHELGHLIVGKRLAAALDAEKAANRFAGALLLPRTALLQEVGDARSGMEWREIALLKAEFGLSMRAVTFRLRDLNVITESRFRTMQRLFMQRGWHKLEPGPPFPCERAHAFERLVFHALAEDYIGEAKAAELMRMSLPAFKRLRAMDGPDAVAHQ